MSHIGQLKTRRSWIPLFLSTLSLSALPLIRFVVLSLSLLLGSGTNASSAMQKKSAQNDRSKTNPRSEAQAATESKTENSGAKKQNEEDPSKDNFSSITHTTLELALKAILAVQNSSLSLL